MNIVSKRHIACINCKHAPSWQSYLHCEIPETGSPSIICIVCHQVLQHPSEHGTSTMGKHLLAKAHIANLYELTESEVTEWTSSTVNETALPILRMQGSRQTTIVSSQRKIIFDIQFDPYWPKWQTKRSKLAAKDFKTSKFHQDTWNRCLMLGFVSAYIPWNAIWNLKLWQSYKALQDNLVLPSATTLSNVCWMDYSLTVDAIRKQLPSQNNVCLALDGWTSTNILSITLVIPYYMDRNWALCEVQLAFDDVYRLFFPVSKAN